MEILIVLVIVAGAMAWYILSTLDSISNRIDKLEMERGKDDSKVVDLQWGFRITRMLVLCPPLALVALPWMSKKLDKLEG